jgi:hypothetical protein
MAEYLFPAMLEKTISFRRLTAKNVVAYEIYATYKDNNYSSGVRNELLDTIKNPEFPQPVLTEIELQYNDNATWKLPDDALLDRDYHFKLYLNDFILSSMYYSYNRITKLITLDTNIQPYNVNDKLTMKYYKDIITKRYAFVEDCQLSVKPVFKDGYNYGDHNIIV